MGGATSIDVPKRCINEASGIQKSRDILHFFMAGYREDKIVDRRPDFAVVRMWSAVVGGMKFFYTQIL
jgi:hypothetical protein